MINKVLNGLDQWKGPDGAVPPQSSAPMTPECCRSDSGRSSLGDCQDATLKSIATAKLTARNEINIFDPPFSSHIQCASAGLGSRHPWGEPPIGFQAIAGPRISALFCVIMLLGRERNV
jgi:hypothetical protein